MMLGVSWRTRGIAVAPTLVWTTDLVRVQLAHSLRTRFICAVIVKVVADVTFSSSVKSPPALEVCAENATLSYVQETEELTTLGPRVGDSATVNSSPG
jgi:hypothetical protein